MTEAGRALMGKVHLTQLLCPERHAIAAVAYVEGEKKPDEVAAELDAALADGGFNPWCGICGSRDLHTEDGTTRFDTIEEALPELKRLEAEQAVARALFRRY